MKGVYQLAFPNDQYGRVYTGRSLDLEKRYQKHIKDLKTGNHHNYKMQEFYDLHGIPPTQTHIEGSFNSPRSEQKIQNTIERKKQWNISVFVDNPTYRKNNDKTKTRRQKNSPKNLRNSTGFFRDDGLQFNSY